MRVPVRKCEIASGSTFSRFRLDEVKRLSRRKSRMSKVSLDWQLPQASRLKPLPHWAAALMLEPMFLSMLTVASFRSFCSFSSAVSMAVFWPISASDRCIAAL